MYWADEGGRTDYCSFSPLYWDDSEKGLSVNTTRKLCWQVHCVNIGTRSKSEMIGTKSDLTFNTNQYFLTSSLERNMSGRQTIVWSESGK